MTALEVIKSLQDECNGRGDVLPPGWKSFEFLLKAFKVMREVAISESFYVNPSEIISERIVDISFELRMSAKE